MSLAEEDRQGKACYFVHDEPGLELGREGARLLEGCKGKNGEVEVGLLCSRLGGLGRPIVAKGYMNIPE